VRGEKEGKKRKKKKKRRKKKEGGEGKRAGAAPEWCELLCFPYLSIEKRKKKEKGRGREKEKKRRGCASRQSIS